MPELLLGGVLLLVLLAGLNLVLLLRRPAAQDRLQLLVEQSLSLQRAEAETTRTQLAATERALAAALGALSTTMIRDQGDARALLETKLREMSEQAAQRLGAIQTAVNQTLADTVEKQMQGSFQRVIDQFGQVQKAMTDVQAVTAQIGDLKRIFSSVKQRGTWGETHLRVLLEDIFPDGGWEANRKLREGSDEVVEFAVVMPVRGGQRPLLALDAKFPAEDYERLILAAEAGDAEAERAARRSLETRLRQEARNISGKYINPPVTVDFAVMYLPTDGLYVEAARMPGLIETLNREHRVLVMGPSLAPALLRTILLGTLTLSIEQRAHDIQNLLGAVRTEMGRMDLALAKLAGNAERMSKSVEEARRRTRAVDRKLRTVTVLEAAQADAVLELEAEVEEETT
ncbi:MAG TPA: DNA recombination protein RmuC [Acetobacteraceae bacterium]|nr:DNA recombination protein RmuC [Acetobacteraceae bacterium]